MTTKKTSFAPKQPQKARKWTMTEIARELNVSRKTLESWRAQGCPGLPPGPVDIEAIKAWAQANGKRAGDDEVFGSIEEKRREEIRKLKLANDLKESRLVERSWVLERHQRAAGELNSFRAKSEAEHPTRFAAAKDDVPACRTIIRGIWDEIFRIHHDVMGKHFEDGEEQS